MPSYRVSWSIDVDADSPEDAAVLAQQIQRDPESTATVFEVQAEKRRWTRCLGFSRILAEPVTVYL